MKKLITSILSIAALCGFGAAGAHYYYHRDGNCCGWNWCRSCHKCCHRAGDGYGYGYRTVEKEGQPVEHRMMKDESVMPEGKKSVKPELIVEEEGMAEEVED